MAFHLREGAWQNCSHLNKFQSIQLWFINLTVQKMRFYSWFASFLVLFGYSDLEFLLWYATIVTSPLHHPNSMGVNEKHFENSGVNTQSNSIDKTLLKITFTQILSLLISLLSQQQHGSLIQRHNFLSPLPLSLLSQQVSEPNLRFD